MAVTSQQTFAARQRSLEGFRIANGYTEHIHKILGKELLLLDFSSWTAVPSDRLRLYVGEHIAASQKRRGEVVGIHNRCYDVADEAVAARVATGTIVAHRGTQEFVGFDDHCMNTDSLPDGTVLAIDLAASERKFNNQGPDILAIRARDIGQLCSRVGRLYGGSWQVRRPRG